MEKKGGGVPNGGRNLFPFEGEAGMCRIFRGRCEQGRDLQQEFLVSPSVQRRIYRSQQSLLLILSLT